MEEKSQVDSKQIKIDEEQYLQLGDFYDEEEREGPYDFDWCQTYC